MAKEKFLLVSLEEEKAKKLAQAISNESCRKILDYLAEKDATETEIASKLSLPLSTVHYNLDQLMKAGLVKVEEFHYSPKGREVNHYKLANQYIIIAPSKSYGIKEKLKSLLPVVLLSALIGFGIEFYSRYFLQKASVPEPAMLLRTASVPEKMMDYAAGSSSVQLQQSLSNYGLWFIVGSVFALILYLFVDYVVFKIKSRNK